MDQRIARAEQLVGLGRFDEVLSALADPGLNANPVAVRMRAIAFLNLDQPDEARTAADRLVELAPDDPLSYLTRSFTWENVDRPWEALADARRATAMAPAAPMVRSRLATCLARSGQLDEAHEEVGWLLSHEPDEPDHWVLLGRVYYHLNRFDEAEGAVLEALRLRADDTDAKVLLAGIRAEGGGRRSESIDMLIAVLKEDPSQASIREMLLEVAFPAKLSKEMLLIIFGLAVMVGGAFSVFLALGYGAVIAYRYRQLTPELRSLVWAEPSTRKRMQLAIGVWILGVVGLLASAVYLFVLR